MEQLISNGPEKVIFLDVDGVLNSNRSTEPTIAEDMVKRLAHIARKTGASIILSSSWRYEYVRHINPESDYYDKDIDHLITILKKYGLEIADTTPLSYINGANARPYEIRTWLAGRANVKRFAILDDEFCSCNCFWILVLPVKISIAFCTSSSVSPYIGIPPGAVCIVHTTKSSR